MRISNLGLVAALLFSPTLVPLNACGSGDTGSTFGSGGGDNDAGGSSDDSSNVHFVSDDGPAGSSSSGGSGSGGSNGGASSGSSGGPHFACSGCFDKAGHCQDGTADDMCGANGATCQNCPGFSQVCSGAGPDAGGMCVSGSGSSGGPQDAGSAVTDSGGGPG
jgi:hypothetical protein